MTPPTDDYLVEKIKEDGDDESLKELISRHSGIYVDMIRKYGGRSMTQTQSYDLMSEKDSNIYLAALTHDSSRSKFSTYLANTTKYKCLSNKTINGKSSQIINFDDIEYDCESKEKNPAAFSQSREFMEKIMDAIEGHPDPRVETVFKARYFSTSDHKLLPWHKIAPMVGLTAQGCINLHERTIKQIQKTIKNGQATF